MAGVVEHKLRGMGLALPETASPKVAKILIGSEAAICCSYPARCLG